VSEENPKSWEKLTTSDLQTPKPLGIGAGCGFAILIIVLSGVICGMFQSPYPFFLGTFVAIAMAFSRQTRMIFVAYLSIVATVVLAFAVICGPMLRGL